MVPSIYPNYSRQLQTPAELELNSTAVLLPLPNGHFCGGDASKWVPNCLRRVHNSDVALTKKFVTFIKVYSNPSGNPPQFPSSHPTFYSTNHLSAQCSSDKCSIKKTKKEFFPHRALVFGFLVFMVQKLVCLIYFMAFNCVFAARFLLESLHILWIQHYPAPSDTERPKDTKIFA